MIHSNRVSHRIATAIAVSTVFAVVALSAHADTIGHWRFEEGTADQGASPSAGAILDSTIPANNGTAVGGPVYRGSPVPNSTLALEFDGVNDSVRIPDGLDFQLTQSLTIEACVNADVLPTNLNGLRQIFFRGDDRGGLDPYYLAVMGLGGGVTVGRFYIDPANGNPAKAVHVDISGLTGQWLHLAGVLDDAADTITVYLNGEAGATLEVMGTRPGAVLTGTNPGVSIGNLQNGIGQNIDGLIDEVRLSNTALTPAEFLDCVESVDDTDGDGVVDEVDNCPMDPNPAQEDLDGDLVGDVCDDDDDGDGVADLLDNCPIDANASQEDFDQDGLGNVCDPSFVGGGFAEDIEMIVELMVLDISAANVSGGNGMIAKLQGKGGILRKVSDAIEAFNFGAIDAATYVAALQDALDKLTAFDNQLAAKIGNGQIVDPQASALEGDSLAIRDIVEGLIALAI